MRSKKGTVFYVLSLLVAVGFVVVGLLLTSKQPHITRDEEEKPPATALRAQGGQDETG